MTDNDRAFWYKHREKFPEALAEPGPYLFTFADRYAYAHRHKKQSTTPIPHPIPKEAIT